MPSVLMDTLKNLDLAHHYFENILAKITQREPDSLFKNINETVLQMEKPVIPEKPSRSSRYLREWYLLKQGVTTNLGLRALKYLCWEVEVIMDQKFSTYITSRQEKLPPKAIKGLLVSIHHSWNMFEQISGLLNLTENELQGFVGRDRTIEKWRSNSPMLLSVSGPRQFAKTVLCKDLLSPKDAGNQWALTEFSEYMISAVSFAIELSIESANRDACKYTLDTLLTWEGWKINAGAFKETISYLILHENVGVISEDLRAAIVKHRLLGDPRLPANRTNWMGVDLSAQKKFIGWLSCRDIIFFFDHVLKGSDRQGRREFWLKYVERMISSRPFLTQKAALELKSISDIPYGTLKSSINKAAFVMDFGEIVVVEFSGIGKAYLYTRPEFLKIIPNMWEIGEIREDRLKNRAISYGRQIAHMGDWQRKALDILAREGIRP